MSQLTQEEILKRYQDLPDDLKKALASAETAEAIYEIGQKFGLNIEETGDMSLDIADIILGVESPRNFVARIIDTLGVDREKAVEITKEINHKIFFPVRENLKKLHGIGTTAELAPATLEEEKPKYEAPMAKPKSSAPPMPSTPTTKYEPSVSPKPRPPFTPPTIPLKPEVPPPLPTKETQQASSQPPTKEPLSVKPKIPESLPVAPSVIAKSQTKPPVPPEEPKISSKPAPEPPVIPKKTGPTQDTYREPIE